MDELKKIVLMTQETADESAQEVVNAQTLLKMRETAKEVLVSDNVLTYAMNLVTATHPELSNSKTAQKYLRFGSSPRAGQALITSARVRAMLHGRYNVDYEDISVLAYPILRHRIKLNFDAAAAGKTADDIIAELIQEVRSSSEKKFMQKRR